MSKVAGVHIWCLLVLWVHNSDGRWVNQGAGSEVSKVEHGRGYNSSQNDHAVPAFEKKSKIERNDGGGFSAVQEAGLGSVLSQVPVEGGRGEREAATNSNEIDPAFEFHENGTKIERKDSFSWVLVGTQDRFDEEISSAKLMKYETAYNEKETQRTEKNKTEEAKAMERTKEDTEEAKETKGESGQNEVKDTEENAEEEIDKSKQIESDQSAIKEGERVEMEENARDVESEKKETTENERQEMKETEQEEREIKYLVNAEEKRKVESKEEDENTNEIEVKEIETTEEEVQGEIGDSSSSNEKEVNESLLAVFTVANKEETTESPAKGETDIDENQNEKGATVEGDEEKIAEMKLLPIPSALLQVSIMSVDYGQENEIGVEARDVEATKMEADEEAAHMEARDLEGSEKGNSDDMPSKVSVTVQEAFQEFVSIEPIDEPPKQAEGIISKKDETVTNHSPQGIDRDITIKVKHNITEHWNISSSTIDPTMKSNQSDSFNVSLQDVSSESRETTESPTTTSMPSTAQDPTSQITNTTTTTTTTTTETTTATHTTTATESTSVESTTIPRCRSPGCIHLSSTLTTSLLSSCNNLPDHICSLLPSPLPPPHVPSLLMANLAEESMEHHLLSSCLATSHSTDLREVVRAVLLRLPWTDKSTLKEKSTILARAFPKLGLLARLEHVEVGGREVVKVVPVSTPLPHQHYLRRDTGSSKLVERKKLLLEVATIIQTGEAGPVREEAEMAGCRLAVKHFHSLLIIIVGVSATKSPVTSAGRCTKCLQRKPAGFSNLWRPPRWRPRWRPRRRRDCRRTLHQELHPTTKIQQPP